MTPNWTPANGPESAQHANTQQGRSSKWTPGWTAPEALAYGDSRLGSACMSVPQSEKGGMGAPGHTPRHSPEPSRAAMSGDTGGYTNGDSLFVTPTKEKMANTIQLDAAARAMQAEDEAKGIVLDPKNSERQYYQDPFTSIRREIWRPGDGDGDKTSDYYDKPGARPPVEKRWRFYQSRTGSGPIKLGVNEPPKYVILDDRTAYEVYASDIHRTKRDGWWSHDFGGGGRIRARRPHRGRSAIGDPDTTGDDIYQFGSIGTKNEKYYFTGEKNYSPIIYPFSEPETPAQPEKRKVTTPSPEESQPKKLRHNQFTPKELMVKHGALSLGKQQRPLPRINTFLKRDPPREPAGFDKEKLYGRPLTHPGGLNMSGTLALFQNAGGAGSKAAEKDSLWVEQGDPKVRRILKKQQAYTHTESDTENQQMSSHKVPKYKPFSETVDLLGSREEEDLPSRHESMSPLPNILDRMAAEFDASTTNVRGQMKKAYDSGSYAAQVEQELDQAKKTIVTQKEQIRELRSKQEKDAKKIERLENTVWQLEGPAEDTDESDE